MELATTYAIFLGALIGLALLHQTSLAAGQLVWKMYARLIQKRLEYPLIATRPQGSTNVSRLDCVFITSFVAANAACLALKITNQAQIATRSGQLFSINVILLYLGGHTSIYADKIFRVPVEKYSLMHRWAGRVCVGEAILHAVTAGIAQPGSFKRLNISLLIAMTTLAITSVVFLRRWLYEFFVKLHLALSMAILVLLWLHVTIKKSLALICLAVATILWTVHNLLRIALIAHRNWSREGPGSHAIRFSDDLKSKDTMLIKVTLKKPVEISAGQYIYLTVPGLARRTYGLLQSHPYFVVESDGDSISMMIESRQGFSRDLRSLDGYHVWVDGPYGGLCFKDFEKVVFIASGIGVSAHILAIRRLLQRQQDRKAVVRRIVLAWLLESADQQQWAKKMVTDLLSRHDTEGILVVFVHGLDEGPPNLRDIVERPGHQPAYYFFAAGVPLNFTKILNNVWTAIAGSMAVSICGPPEFERQARKAVRLYHPEITLYTNGYQPDETQESKSSRSRFQHGIFRKPVMVTENHSP